MYRRIEKVLGRLEATEPSDTQAVLNVLRRELCQDDFGFVLLQMPMESYPRVSALLPRMASHEVQKNWTGASGTILLRQTLNFTRIVNTQSYEVTGKGLAGKRILDYGCGYGRILRTMMYYARLEDLAGCDPWDRSLEICRNDGIECRLELSDYLPDRLPFEESWFDVIYAFSVFTHTSRRASIAALNAMRRHIRPDGFAVVTIRPEEYWELQPDIPEDVRNSMRERHEAEGFAFQPHNRAPIDGDITYGDASMSLDMLGSLSNRWKVVGYELSLDDLLQISAVLRPV